MAEVEFTKAPIGITTLPVPVTQGGTGTSTQFTAGSVVFAGVAGVYSQDNANFFYDDTNNRFGVGTNTPDYPLTVNVNDNTGSDLTNVTVRNTNNGSGSFSGFRAIAGPSGTDGAHITGSHAALASYGFVNGMTFSPGSSGQDIGFRLTAACFGGTALGADIRIRSTGDLGTNLGASNPSAKVHIGAGVAAAGGAPFKINPGTNLTAPENGALENDGTHVYFTLGGVRYQLDQQSSGVVIAAGTYTPTLTAINNLAASTAYLSQYMRVGNTVTVSGYISLSPGASFAVCQTLVSLPIASNFSALENCGGTFVDSLLNNYGAIAADITNDGALLSFNPNALFVGFNFSYHFTYQII